MSPQTISSSPTPPAPQLDDLPPFKDDDGTVIGELTSEHLDRRTQVIRFTARLWDGTLLDGMVPL